MKKVIAIAISAYLKVETVQSLFFFFFFLIFFLWLAAMWEPRGYYCRSHSSARRPTTSTGSPPGAYAQWVWVWGRQQVSGRKKETSWWQGRTHMPNRRSALSTRFGSARLASARLGSAPVPMTSSLLAKSCNIFRQLVHSWPTLASDVPRFGLSLSLCLSRSLSRRSRKRKELLQIRKRKRDCK